MSGLQGPAYVLDPLRRSESWGRELVKGSYDSFVGSRVQGRHMNMEADIIPVSKDSSLGGLLWGFRVGRVRDT